MFRKLLPIVLLLSSCASYQSVTGPRLTFNGARHQGWIVNRRPPAYGDGLEGGCVSMGEFDIALSIDSGRLSGVIRDVNSRQPVEFAQLTARTDQDSTIVTTADAHGSFRIAGARRIRELSVLSVGFRQLILRPRF